MLFHTTLHYTILYHPILCCTILLLLHITTCCRKDARGRVNATDAPSWQSGNSLWLLDPARPGQQSSLFASQYNGFVWVSTLLWPPCFMWQTSCIIQAWPLVEGPARLGHGTCMTSAVLQLSRVRGVSQCQAPFGLNCTQVADNRTSASVASSFCMPRSTTVCRSDAILADPKGKKKSKHVLGRMC